MSKSNDRISIRDHMVAQACNGADVFDALKMIGVKTIELQIDLDFTTPHVRKKEGGAYALNDAASLATFQNDLKGQGVDVCAVLLMTDFSSEKADEHVDWTVAAAKIAKQLGAPVIRVDPLTRNKELPIERVRENFIARINEALARSADSGIDFGMENHGPAGNDPAFIDAVLGAVGNSRLGLTLDTGNFYWWGVPLEELYALLERYAAKARHTHVKNINYPASLASERRPIGLDYGKYCCPLDEGNIDLRKALRLLRDSGYQRTFCIENESLHKFAPERKLDVLRRDVAAIRAAMLQ